MKKVLFLIVVWAVCGGWANAQTGLKVLWKIDNWPSAELKEIACFSPDGKSVYFPTDKSVSDGKGGWIRKSRVYQISSETGETISTSELSEKGEYYDFDLSASGNKYATVQVFDGLKIWDAKTHKLLTHLPDSKGLPYILVAISPDEKFAAFVKEYLSSDQVNLAYRLCVYDLEAAKYVIDIESDMITDLKFSPDGKWLAVGRIRKNYDGESDLLSLFSTENWKETRIVLDKDNGGGGFDMLQFSSDSKKMAAKGGGSCFIYNLEESKLKEIGKNAANHYPLEITLLPGDNNYIIRYTSDDAMADYRVIYNNDVEVSKYDMDYFYYFSNEYEGNNKIFAMRNNNIAVLTPSTSGVSESPKPNITVMYADNLLTITVTGIENQTAKIIISDLSGKEVYAGSVEIKEGGTSKICLKLESGIYLYKLICNNQEFTGKFEVVR